MAFHCDLRGHVAIVTGANHGIGEATARALAGCGAAVLAAFFRPSDPDDFPQRYRENRAHDAAGMIAESERPDAATARLTKRELEILQLVRLGRRNREIAKEIGLEEKTVKNHINSIYAKLGIGSRVEAMALRMTDSRG